MGISLQPIKEDEESLLPSSPTTSTRPATDVLANLAPRVRYLPRLLVNLFHQFLLFTIPSFLKRDSAVAIAEKTPRPLAAPKKHSTEYLDGVRGVASFIVFVFHWSHIHYPGVNTGYGGRQYKSLWQLPMIKFLYAGAGVVAIFFVVSGYVLSHRFVQKMHKHEFESLFTSLTSLTFRRAIRLFLPAAGSSVLAYLCADFGLLDIPKEYDGKKFHHGLRAFLAYIDFETTPWTWELHMKGFYNPQLWSIAVEFRGSIVVFILILGLARTRMSVRMLVELLLCVHAFVSMRWDVALFVAGMLVAEIDVFINISTSRKALMQKKRTKLILWILVLIGIFFAGYPRDHAEKSWGYTFVTQHLWPFTTYRRRFWLAVGSILIVGPMPFLPSMHTLFCLPLIRYLGKISFALYLIHGLGNRTIGWWILQKAWATFGQTSTWECAISFIVSSMLYLPIIIWWSDVYWRAIDIPATNFAKWLETKSKSTIST